jgi:chromosome segregation ATPase
VIESIMYIGIGFLIDGLFVIGVIPLVHARAERLTARRMEALNPLSMAEIQADKDQLRADFAMSTRRLEMNVEQLKVKNTNHMTEIVKKSEAIGRLKLELGEKITALFVLESKEKQLMNELQGFKSDLSSKSASLTEAESVLSDTQAELAQVTVNYREISVNAERQHVELVALRAQAEALRRKVQGYEMEPQVLQDHLRNKTAEAEGLSHQLAGERTRAAQLSAYIDEVDRQLVVHKAEEEVLVRRVEELTAKLDEQARFLADYQFISDRNGAYSAWPDMENRHEVAADTA